VKKMTAAERIQALEARLGVSLARPEHALTALTHKSYVNEQREPGLLEDNQRLEFFGDSVLNLAVSHRLMERFPKVPEGELTRLRASIVNEEGLARVARRLGLGELLLLGRGEERTGGRERNSVLADAMEAVIASVYLNLGLEAVLALVDRHFAELLAEAEQAVSKDYKTRLQLLAQEQLKAPARYRVVGESGPEHAKVFEVEVVIHERPYARATGRNKKEAEQAAAQATLELLARGEMLPEADTGA
jgi:ribonuclease-3